MANTTGVETPAMLRPLYYDMDGFRVPAAFNLDRFRSAVSYKAKADDVFIATYPKCGTTWLQEICYLIYNDGERPANHVQRLIDTPFFEMLGADCVVQMKKPGALKTHLPFNLTPYSPEAKYVCAIRNPKDCVVSFFYHTSKVYPAYNFSDGTFPEFFELFINGQTDFGCYFDHVVSWLRQKDKSNIHFIYFEDVKKNGSAEILKLGRFLGEEYETKLKNGLLEKVVDMSSIQKMKSDYSEFKLNPQDEKLPEGIRQFAECNLQADAAAKSSGSVEFKDFVRKGQVNDWRNHFTPEMNSKIEEKIRTMIEPEFPEIVEKWRQCGVFEPL